MIPVLGLGTYQIKDRQKILKLVELAVKTIGSYKLIDTASVYQNEQFIGEALNLLFEKHSMKREDIFITSKLGPSDQGYDNCIASVKKSLEKLQTTYLDLYLIHWPGTSGGIPPNDTKHSVLRKESWQAMEKLYEEGILKNIGVSNYTVNHLSELLSYAKIPPVVNQVECHPYLDQYQLRSFCDQNNIHIQCYSSLGGIKGKDEVTSFQVCGDSRLTFVPKFIEIFQLLTDVTVKKIATFYNKTTAQILLKWALQHNMSVIPKTENPERLKENSELFDFKLSEEELKELDNLNKNLHYCWDPTPIL